jgi:hypothetical protein
MTVDGLVRMGFEWLSGREEREEWSHVWRALLEHTEHLPEDITVDGLVRMGFEWLSGREEREEWSHVWEKLLEHQQHLPENIPVSQLLYAGFLWVKKDSDKKDWAFIWEKILDNFRLTKNIKEAEFLQIGYDWLLNNKQHDSWSFIYEQFLIRRLDKKPFLNMGVDWLCENSHRPEAYGIAIGIIKLMTNVTEDQRVVIWSIEWLDSNYHHPSWTFLWGALWNALPTMRIFNLIIPWINSRPKKGIFWVLEVVQKKGTEEMVNEIKNWANNNPDHPLSEAVIEKITDEN